MTAMALFVLLTLTHALCAFGGWIYGFTAGARTVPKPTRARFDALDTGRKPIKIRLVED